ncbi:MAG: hypothetical protein HOP36_08845 [Methyloglobulus sp.]|nr:hypothetical protein [Methyloglobulus sp.]
MALSNRLDDLNLRQLDLENKLVLPTAKLVAQVKAQLNDGYQGMLNSLADANSFVATSAQQLYAHPAATTADWYGQIRNVSTNLVVQAQGDVLPIYQNWEAQISTGKARTIQAFQAFWDNPQQATLETFAPTTQLAAKAYGILERDLQFLLDNPGQYLVATFSPATAYLASVAGSAKIMLTASYATLADALALIKDQPSVAFKALYHNTLSALLDGYSDAVSSLLVMT